MPEQNSNLIEFPTSYVPTFNEAQRLDEWQRQWKMWRAELRHEFDMKGFTGYERMLSKERFHQGCRNNWKIYTNQNLGLETQIKSG